MHTVAIATAALATVLASTAQASLVYASHVEQFSQGLQRNGSAVDPSRSDASKALFAPQGGDTANFVSLGMNGSLILSFGSKFGTSVSVTETTYGNAAGHPESANVYVGLGLSWNTATWYLVGSVLNTADGMPMSLAAVNGLSGATAYDFLKITDTTLSLSATASTDGFDVDGVSSFAVVPAPGAFALMGLAGVIGGRRRRRTPVEMVG